MSQVRVAAVHAAPEYLDVAATVEKACGLIAEAGAQGARLVVFPEVFLPGFPYWINCYPPLLQTALHARYLAASVTVPGPEIRRIQEAARAAGTAVVLGVNEREGSSLYNTQVFVSETGDLLGRHRKLQPTFAERTIWAAGDASTLSVFDTAIGRVGGLVCWEHTMNLARHALVGAGEQIHAGSWPSLSTTVGFADVYDDQVEAMSRNHAITGQCFVVVSQNPVNQQVLDVLEEAAGPQDLVTLGGGWSAIIHPMTPYLAGPHTGPEETILVADIDLADVDGTKVFVDSVGHFSRSEVLSLHVDNRPKKAVTFAVGDGVRREPLEAFADSEG
ncbi:carbon-nitrogen hydrolase family protein [Nocardioides pantholopis]|uniref:carbon-nitrogen hydrolase family protein n=1 Tax=Nocardioides pantholopis TaxID=2483798 RepID=UPI000FDC4CFF|nr:carbon-nitrogen hydrolase family protein [Nocardioides pantholopis]